MSLSPTEIWTYVLVILSFGGYLYIGYANRVRDTKGFYVAGQGIPPIANGAATAADWMSAASFISMAGMISFMGYDGAVYLMGWTGGYVLLALLLAPYLRKFGKYTVPDFVGDRYYSHVARTVAAICAIFVSFTYVAGQMRGVGIVFSRYLKVDITVGVIIGMAIVAFFAIIGGMKGITWTQVAQYCVLICAYLIPAFFLSTRLTDNVWPVPQLAFTFSDLAPRLDALQVDLGLKEYILPFTGKSMIDVLCITIALMVGTAGLPHVIVRFYTVPSVRSARYSAGWALVFIGLLYTTAPAIAVIAKYNLLTTLTGAARQELTQEQIAAIREGDAAQIASMGLGEKTVKAIQEGERTWYFSPNPISAEQLRQNNRWIPAWETPKLLVIGSDKGLGEDGQVYPQSELVGGTQQPVAWLGKDGKPTDVRPTWMRDGGVTIAPGDAFRVKDDRLKPNPESQNEVYIDNDIIVLSTPEVAKLPPFIVGLVAAGGLAAALSTASGLLLVISSSFSHDIFYRLIKPDASEQQRLLVGRVVILLAVIIAGLLGIFPPAFVAQVVAYAFGLAASSFFPIIILGIFDKRTNNYGAIAGMSVGLIFTIAYILGAKTFGMPLWFFGVSAEGIGTLGAILNFIVAFIVSHLTPPPPKEIQDLVESVRVPRGAGTASAH
ncbi:MAG: cation acetate symporter [Chloroflexaceae bacterium]|nr:cation acetate symporter [Chloroflexaceae bacterium]